MFSVQKDREEEGVQRMNTVGEAVQMLNEKHLHPQGFHLFYVRDELIDDGGGEDDPYYNLMRQTFDWRFGAKPDKKQYSVTLSAADMEFIGKAMEVYHQAVYTRYLEPVLKRLIQNMGECERGESPGVLEADI